MSRLELRGVTVRFGAGRRSVTPAQCVDLEVPDSSIKGLVGESGSGKSSLAKAVVGLAPLVEGQILLDGKPLRTAGKPLLGRGVKKHRLRVQMIFQDPYASLDPRRSIGDSIAEGVEATGHQSRKYLRSEVRRLLELVRLDPDRASISPKELSGGQRQRVAIARALAASPSVLIADEITSALDVSVQGAILNLLRDLQAELGISVLFVSHNLAVVRYLSSSIDVMYCGQVVESGTFKEVTKTPQHPYTAALLKSVPRVGTGPNNSRDPLIPQTMNADPPDPQSPPSGCRFHPRCPIGPRATQRRQICTVSDPSLEKESRPNRAACFFPGESTLERQP